MAANSPGTAGSDPAGALYRRVTWRILPFLMVGYVVAFADRSNVGFAKLQFTCDLGFSEMAATGPNPEAPSR